ncbi:MAG: hypothetical protein GY810_26675 [Aureispira sp.]|nr:hypothetical protein [Aureispira sp.]
MEQLVLTSSNLSKRKEWSSGSINVSEIVSKWQENTPDNVSIDAKLSKKELILDWSEVSTPKQLPGFRDLVGRHLASYKFQYLGEFKHGKHKIKGKSKADGKAYEYNAAYVDTFQRFAYESSQAGEGQCNSTWLIDFLHNAEKISEDPLRSETLKITNHEDGHFQFLLQKNSDSGDLIEFQTITFSTDWKHMESEYYADISLD